MSLPDLKQLSDEQLLEQIAKIRAERRGHTVAPKKIAKEKSAVNKRETEVRQLISGMTPEMAAAILALADKTEGEAE
jgi:hypothetical protein